MKARLFALALALCGTSAFAQTTVDMNVLAAESGLSARQVGMLFGASAAYAEFKASYVQVKRKFTAAVGQQRYEALLAAYKAREEAGQIAAAPRQPESGS